MDQGSSPGAAGPPGNGASVGFWQDKSGSGHHAVKVSGSPKYQTQSFNNSFPCIEPNGGYFEISNSATEMDQLSAFTFVTAFKWTNTSTGDKLMYKGATGWHRNYATFTLVSSILVQDKEPAFGWPKMAPKIKWMVTPIRTQEINLKSS